MGAHPIKLTIEGFVDKDVLIRLKKDSAPLYKEYSLIQDDIGGNLFWWIGNMFDVVTPTFTVEEL